MKKYLIIFVLVVFFAPKKGEAQNKIDFGIFTLQLAVGI
jgi:hypothetical protein